MLTVVGTGYAIAGQVTAETVTSIRSADKLFYVAADPITPIWLRGLNPTAESLDSSYGFRRDRSDSYEEMVERVLTPLRAGLRVCAAFYGHPGVLCDPGHEAVRRAGREGFAAMMLPGVSAIDCLIADLEIEPSSGLQSYLADDFIVNRRRHDPRCMLVLWQTGAIGVRTTRRGRLWSRAGIQRLEKRLLEQYPSDHVVAIYEAAHFPTCPPVIQRIPLNRLGRAGVTIASTLYVPPR